MRRGPPRALCALAAGAAIGAGCATSRGPSAADDVAGSDAGLAPTSDAADAKLTQTTDAMSLLDSGCATARMPVERDPIYLLVVLDGSGSMAEDGKWQAAVPALEQFVDVLAARNDASFGVGLTVFSDTNDPTNGAGPYTSIDVPIAFVDAAQAQKLHARLDGAAPKGQTPTLAVMTGQYAQLESFSPRAPLLAGGRKVLVLMTDGVPYPDPNATQKPACVQATSAELAKGAPQGPITTFAVGIGYTFP